MSWGSPTVLWVLLLLPLIAWLLVWANRQRQRALAQLGDVILLVDGRRSGRFRQSLLWLIALTTLIIALARPQWGQQPSSAPPPPLQILFVLDVSHSMLAADMLPDRFTQARNTILTLLPSLPDAEIGLVLFAGESSLSLPLTTEHQLFLTQLARSHPSTISPQGTALAEAIETAVVAFDPLQYSQKIILLLSDGEGHDHHAARAAQKATANRIALYAIGFGSTGGAPLPVIGSAETLTAMKVDQQGNPVLSRLNEATLQQIAHEGNGRYFPAELKVSESLLAALAAEQQANHLNTAPIERFQLFLLVSLIIFIWRPSQGDQKKPGQTEPESR